MTKDSGLESALNGIAKAIFGRARDEGICVTCGSNKVKPEDFRNDLSRREYRISMMCQACQDDVFETKDTAKALDVIDRDFKR